MNDVAAHHHQPLAPPTAGLVGVQARELAELRNQYLIARDFPRDVPQAMEAIEDAFGDPTTAEVAEYGFAKGGNDISGPSIHAAQLIATLWGNIAFGWRELSRGTGDDGKRYSEVEAYAIDLQSRVPSRLQFIVPHWRDTRSGGYPIRDEGDIYMICANAAQRRKRACILSVVHPRAVTRGIARARATNKARADTSPEGIAKLLAAFAQFSVTQAQIEARIQRKLDAMTPEQWVGLRNVWTNLNEGVGKVPDFFDPDPAAAAAGQDAGAAAPSAADKVKDKLRARKGAQGAAEAPAAGDPPAPDASPAAPPEGGVQGDLMGAMNKGVGLAGTDDGGDAREAPSAQQLRDQLMQAKDKDKAMEVLDLARGLPKPDYDSLVDLMDQRWPEA